jgi:hypothetical protein
MVGVSTCFLAYYSSKRISRPVSSVWP